jgi:hypothetical protein
MKQDQLLSDRQRAELEFNANRVTMRSEIRNGKPVLVDVIKYGPNKGQEVVFPDYVRIQNMVSNNRSKKLPRKDKAPLPIEQAIFGVAMFVAGLLVYLSIIGL